MRKLFLTAVAMMLAMPLAAQAQDATAGKKVFTKCLACHKVGPGAANGVGPDLNGVVGRKAGTEAGYAYSDAMKNSGLTWDDATLTKYLHKPKEVVPGTLMSFAGLNSDKDITNVVAFLKTFKADGSPATP